MAEIPIMRSLSVMGVDGLRRLHMALWLDDPTGLDPFCVANRCAIRVELLARDQPLCLRARMGAPCVIADGPSAWTDEACRGCGADDLFPE